MKLGHQISSFTWPGGTEAICRTLARVVRAADDAGLRFASKVHMLHRRDSFRASKIMVDRARANPTIEIHTNTAIEEVLGDSKVESPDRARPHD